MRRCRGNKHHTIITRVELVAFHTALTMFAEHDWLGTFSDSLSSLQAIRHHNTNPDICSSLHYHHHMLLLKIITDLLETKRLAGFHVKLHKLRVNTNIRGNDLAVAAAKLAVRDFDRLLPAQTTRVSIEEIAPRLSHWVM